MACGDVYLYHPGREIAALATQCPSPLLLASMWLHALGEIDTCYHCSSPYSIVMISQGKDMMASKDLRLKRTFLDDMTAQRTYLCPHQAHNSVYDRLGHATGDYLALIIGMMAHQQTVKLYSPVEDMGLRLLQDC
jgi:hypothetical protein